MECWRYIPSNPDLIVGITGSREGHPRVRAWMRRFVATHGHPILWVLGGARGVDSAAEALCRENEWPHAVIYPQWKRYGKFWAPKFRNMDMVQMVATGKRGVFLAFPQRRSRGTYHCMTAAQQAGLTIYAAMPTG